MVYFIQGIIMYALHIILLLSHFFLQTFCIKYSEQNPYMPKRALQIARQYMFAGNNKWQRNIFVATSESELFNF